MRRSFPLLFVVLLLVAGPVSAQTLGTITGEVKDASGAIIPGAIVTATNTGTNAAREMPSNEAGAYTFSALPPGPYVVKSELQGFKTVEQRVDLHVEQTVRVNFTMEIGTLSETAEVTGVAPLITTENATVGTVIENRRIVELPLNGRNFLSLVALSPNVSAEFAGAGQAGDRQGGSRASQQLSISGQRREFNYYTLDGTDNTDVNFNTYILLPSVDALEEFKVQTGIYSAEFGRAASQVNVVTKSGTNQFHGTVFEFHRNDAMDSRPFSFSAAQASLPKPPFSWNQYGYTLGGPIWSNKVFFMSNWEGYRDRKQNQQNYNLPLAAWRTGDFSSYSGVLYDPATCTVNAAGTRSCATFPGNRIPANRISPTSLKLLEFYPEPNATGTDATGTVNSYTGTQDRVIDKDQFTQRIDFVQNSSSTWMGRYSHSRDDEISPALKLNGSKLINRIHQGMVGNTRTLSPTVVNEFRFGYNSFYNTFGRELAFVRDVTSELAIPGMNPLPESAWGIPSIGINGLSGFGDSTEGPYTNNNKVYEFIDNVSWIRGRHSFKVGAHFRIDHYNQVGNQFPRGGFQFDGRATGSLVGNATPIAPSFADFLLGYQRLSELSVQLAVTEFRALSQSYYITDTWRMRDNMTLDLGLRYEYVPPFRDEGGTLINASLPVFGQGLPVADKSLHPTLVRIGEGDFYEDFNIRYNPAIQTARDGRLGNSLIKDDKLDFAPRAGWAWTPTPITSIRAGVGMFYMQDTGNPRFDMARNAAGRRQDTSDQNFNQNWNAPFVGSGTNACGVQPPIVCINNHYVLGNDYDRKTPRMLQYLFNVQREIGPSAALEIGYLGSRSYQLERMFDRNDVLPGPGNTQDKRPYPEFTRIQSIGNVAEARYNSLTAKLTRRLNNGFSALVGYTLSKSTDNGSGIRTLNGDQLFPQNSNCVADEVASGCEWGASIFDVRHRVVSSILYELPFGAGKPFLQEGIGSAILGGWQFTNILSLSSGFPRNPNTGTDRANLGHGDQRPDPVAGQDPNDGPKTIQQWFNTSAFVLQPQFEYGDAVRNSLFGPGIFNFDMSILRNFTLGGSKSLQFRLEAFNTFNQPVWNDPNTSVTSSQYGQITSTRKPMRELQLGVKFGF
jgi:hypothetical protein